MARSNYHHGGLRNAMIEAALRLVERKGLRGFSMREAAREAGVAPSAPYRHFEDKSALMTAVAEVALRELSARSDLAIAQAGPSPLAQFRAAGIAYVRFAGEQPSHFLVLHDPEYADRSRSELIASYLARNNQQFREILQGAHEDGELRGSRELVELTASTLMYGLARRIVDGQFDTPLTPEDIDRLAEQMTHVLAVGIASFSQPNP